MTALQSAEHQRLADSKARKANWKNWGPYLSERAWGTVREDYSPTGEAWEYFPHDHARSRDHRRHTDPPFAPRGCFAQAWSVAEVLRAWQLTEK